MAYALVLERALFAGAVVLMLAGALSAWSAQNTARKLAGLLVAMLGAVMAVVALDAPAWIAVAGAALALAQLVVGAAVAVRLHESYGSSETADADRVEADAERGP